MGSLSCFRTGKMSRMRDEVLWRMTLEGRQQPSHIIVLPPKTRSHWGVLMTKRVIQTGQSGSWCRMGWKGEGVRLKKNLSHNNLVQVEKRDLNRWLGRQKAKDRKTRIIHSLTAFVVVLNRYSPACGRLISGEWARIPNALNSPNKSCEASSGKERRLMFL